MLCSAVVQVDSEISIKEDDKRSLGATTLNAAHQDFVRTH